jgi:hypothetical protein
VRGQGGMTGCHPLAGARVIAWTVRTLRWQLGQAAEFIGCRWNRGHRAEREHVTVFQLPVLDLLLELPKNGRWVWSASV